MNTFVLDRDLLERIKDIVAFASKPENIFDPRNGINVPGNVAGHILERGDLHAVFSVTIVHGRFYRYLTVCSTDQTPCELVAWTLARLFGFRGAKTNEEGIVTCPSKSWAVDVEESLNMVLILEQLFDESIN